MFEYSIKILRYQRQYLFEKASEHQYDDLFRKMSPIPTLFWIEPGTAPNIMYRCDFDDEYANDISRRMRRILKGRFQGGHVGYVFKEEMPLFKAAYQKPIRNMTEHDDIILDILTKEGPMDNSLIKEISGLLSKEVSKSLQKLQKAFIVFEDQIDKDNDRSWYLLEEEFSEMDFKSISKEEAMKEVIRRFADLNVFINEEMIKSYTKFTNKEIKLLITSLVETKVLISAECFNKQGYLLKADISEIEKSEKNISENSGLEKTEHELYNSVMILDLNDYLVKSNELTLKERFGKSEYKILRYLYKEGEFIGRLLGFFRFGPADLEDVQVDIDDPTGELKNIVIEAIHEHFEGQENHLKRYQGNILE